MSLRDLPEWAIRPLVAALVLGVLFLGGWIFSNLWKPRDGEVRGSSMMFGCGILLLVWVAVMLPVGLFASDLTAPGQLAPWLCLILVPLALGALIIWSQYGVLARFDASGVIYRRLNGRTEAVRWSDFTRVRRGGALWSGAVFEQRTGRPFLLSSYSVGAGNLMVAAREAGVRGIEDFAFPPSPDGQDA